MLVTIKGLILRLFKENQVKSKVKLKDFFSQFHVQGG